MVFWLKEMVEMIGNFYSSKEGQSAKLVQIKYNWSNFW